MKYLPVAIILGLLVSCSPIDGVKLPSVDLLLLDSTTHLDIANIPKGNPSILIYFNPDCPHCQVETKGFISKMDSLRDVKFYFITGEDHAQMRAYNNQFQLYKYQNITMGRDYKYSFPGKFKNVAPPYLVICDEYNRVRGYFLGERPTSDIIRFINSL